MNFRSDRIEESEIMIQRYQIDTSVTMMFNSAMKTLENTIPEPVDMAKIKASIDDAIQRLLNDRKYIIQDFTERLKILDNERNTALNHNSEYLKELGFKSDDIPAPPPLNLSLGTIRKLTKNQITSILTDFMDPKIQYSSSVLMDRLLISYKDFKRFVEENPSFINGSGKNKGRYYVLVSS